MKRKSDFILKGNIVYRKNQKEFSICENGYVVCKDGIVEGSLISPTPSAQVNVPSPLTSQGQSLTVLVPDFPTSCFNTV